jgi:leucine dehydrogenase
MMPTFGGNHNMDFDLFEYGKTREFGDLFVKIDNNTGLCAVIAIHNLNHGPALGGCRCIEYKSSQAAIKDAMRLARAMSFKAAILGIPHGGGKAVLMRPMQIENREAYFKAYGRFVDSLGGRYITAVDSGTSPSDMDIIQSVTPYVTSLSSHGDTSAYTALGVKFGIEAAIKFKLKKNNVKGCHVAIQGLGNVGYALAKLLHEDGARLTVADTNQVVVQKAVTEFDAISVAPDAIHQTKCDVFAPCALGAIINDESIPEFNTSIIAGAANNQLKTWEYGKYLHERDILYAPDYVINAGGLVYAAGLYDKESMDIITQRLRNIHSTLTEIFERSVAKDAPTSSIADQLAHERLMA